MTGKREAFRRPFGREYVAILSGREAADLDRWSIDELGVPSSVLIESAGRAAATVVQHLAPEGRVAVLVGKGNNGADAVVVARTLTSRGRSTVLIPVQGDFDRSLLHGWDVPQLALEEAEAEIRSAAVVVDGVLGTGLQGVPREPAARAIRFANQATGLVVALDIASGVDADTGAASDTAVRADVTVGFGAAKLGAVLQPGRQHSGRLIVVDIGFPPQKKTTTRFITPAWANARLPTRAPDAHKNSVGALCIVAGSPGMAGAAVLAGRAALRSGAGYVRVVTDKSNHEVLQAALPEAVFVDRHDPSALHDALSASRAVLIGPAMGVDTEAAEALKCVLSDLDPGKAIVVDADALTVLGSELVLPEESVLTPHLGEMERLTGVPRDELKSNPFAAARELAKARNVVVLLKGAPTVVAAPTGEIWVAGSQSSDLAVAGMGDTLAGTVASLAAQGLAPASAAAVALEVTARAAACAGGGVGLTPSDVIDHLGAALRERGPGSTDLPFPFVLFDQDLPR